MKKPNDLDRFVLYVLLAIGTFSVYRWAFKALEHLTDRAYTVVDYKYLTKDRKVIEPEEFTEIKEKSVNDS